MNPLPPAKYKATYPQDPTRHWVCRWMCPRPASGGPAASHCVSRSQTSSRTFGHRRGTNARQCSKCSSECRAGCTGSNPTHSPKRWCGRWHQNDHPHWKESYIGCSRFTRHKSLFTGECQTQTILMTV